MTYTVTELLAEVRVQGVTLTPEGDSISAVGSPSPMLADEIRRLKPSLLPYLRRQRAFELVALLDGPGPYETRMKHWPEYADLCARIAAHEESNQ